MNALKTILSYVYHIPITNKHYRTPAIIIAITMSSPELHSILWGTVGLVRCPESFFAMWNSLTFLESLELCIAQVIAQNMVQIQI